jgi:pimeloyl-ACP methyl ester carboxylesterase
MFHRSFGIRTLVATSFALLSILFGFIGSAHAQFKAEVKYAQVGEVSLAYYTRGQGDPMILINGYSATMSMWDPALIEELSKNNTLILFDNRGIGLSSDTKENKTTIAQMADDAAGLVQALGYKKTNVLGWSMGARVAQQFLIRHPDLVIKGILCAPNPGGKYQVKANKKTEEELNNPHLSVMENVALLFPNNESGRQAAKDALAREQAAKVAGTIPDDFVISKESKLRQTRARTTLWDADNKNFVDLKNIKVPVLVADGQYDILDVPKNSQIIANQIPYAWLAFFDGGHAFLFQQHQKFAQTVNAFLR